MQSVHPQRVVVALLAMVIVALASGAFSPVRGEQPSWQKVRSPLYSVLYHQYRGSRPAVNARQGIWRFDLESGSWSRLAPFFYSCRGGSSIEQWGRGSYLTAMHDNLLFQGFKSWIEIDPASGRFVRRMQQPAWVPPGAARAATPVIPLLGDSGPFVAQQDGARWGIEEGVYGWSTETISWASVGAPSYVAFARLAGQPEGEFRDTNRLSFDPRRGGFWMVDGAAGPASVTGIMISFVPADAAGLDWSRAWRRTADVQSVSGGVFLGFLDVTKDELLVSVIGQGTNAVVAVDAESLDASVLLSGEYYSGRDPMPWTLARLPAEPPTTYEQTIPIVVKASGRGGTWWSSELWLYNPSAEPTTVTARRVVKPAVARTVELPAHGSLRVADALAWLGGGASGDGVTHDALVLTSPYRWGAQVVATSRVWTPALDPSERVRGGTMGQGVPAVPGTAGYSNHFRDLDSADAFTGMNAMLVVDHREPGRFRHNLGLANDRDEPVRVTLSWGMVAFYDIAPLPAGYPRAGEQQVVEVPAHSVKMVSLEELFPASVRAGLPSQIAVTGERPVALWLSMVDNLTGDGMHVPYSLWWMVGDRDSQVATPAVAHLPGANDTHWRSDLYVTAREEEGEWGVHYYDTPIARFRPAWNDRCGGPGAASGLAGHLIGVNPSPVTLAFPWGYRSIVPDVVRQLPACADETNVRGALDLRASSWMGAYVRTYTTRADGGTYGEMMPFYPPYGWPVQHFAGIEIGPRFRLNLGLYNGNKDHAIRHRLTLYAADGTKVAEREATLAPHASVQERLETMLGRPLDSFAEGTYGLTVLPLDDTPNGVQGRSWAYVSMVDNITGDPTNWW